MIQLSRIERVVNTSVYVSINYDNLEAIRPAPVSWLERSPVNLSELSAEQKIAFLFVFNSISFGYWGEPKWNSSYKRGTWSMLDCLKKAMNSGKPILEPDYLANLRVKDLEEILHGNIPIPLFEERLRILRELGQSIKSYRKFIEQADYDASRLADKLVAEIPSFRDSSEYQNETIDFNKRPQLLASDLGTFLDLKNLDKLTACADYILPMVLRHKGILVYSSELAHKVDNQIEIAKDSEEEIEIRANTVWAVELIKQQTGLTAMQVNDYLWLMGDSVPETEYYHLTRTTAY